MLPNNAQPGFDNRTIQVSRTRLYSFLGKLPCLLLVGIGIWLLMEDRAMSEEKGTTVSPSNCPKGRLHEAQRSFQGLYDARKFSEAVGTLEPALSECEGSLSPDARAKILSDLSIAAFRSGDKKLCLSFIDRVPAKISLFSDVAFAIEHNRGLCDGEAMDDDPVDCRKDRDANSEILCAGRMAEAATKQLKRVVKTVEEKLVAETGKPVAGWRKQFQKATEARAGLVDVECRTLLSLDSGGGNEMAADMAQCEVTLVKSWIQEMQDHFGLPGKVPRPNATSCASSSAFDCPAVREAERKRAAAMNAKITRGPALTDEESDKSKSQKLKEWRRVLMLDDQRWLAWREAWCVSFFAAEAAARTARQAALQAVDTTAACLIRVTKDRLHEEKAIPGP
jgi:hypothetical protein